MRLGTLCTPENVERTRYAQITAAVIAIALCAYLGFFTFRGISSAWATERTLNEMTMQSASLSHEAATLKKQQEGLPPLNYAGVESFAVQFNRWARQRGVSVESFAPEGSPSLTEIKIDDTKLGNWNAFRIRIQGRGDFIQLMSLLDEFRDPHMPVQIDELQVQAMDSSSQGRVSYNILCTVYEKKSG